MKLFKRAARKALTMLGYEVVSSSRQHVRYENYLNIVQAYEQRLNSTATPVPANNLRPRLLARLLGTVPSQAYFIIQALWQSRDVRGDVCEFGVAQGETSALIANEIAACASKRLHLFDSFAGLPRPTEKDKLKDDIFALGSMEAYTGTMSCPEALVRTRLQALAFPEHRYVIHKGFLEQTLHEDRNLPGEVSFAYVDLDFYEPIKTALQFLDRATSVGSMIVVDDYNFFSTGAKLAVDEFVQARNSASMAYEMVVPHTCYGHCAVLTRKSMGSVFNGCKS